MKTLGLLRPVRPPKPLPSMVRRVPTDDSMMSAGSAKGTATPLIESMACAAAGAASRAVNRTYRIMVRVSSGSSFSSANLDR
jgi:hypothetical protein